MKCPKCKGDNFEEQELSKVMFCEDCSYEEFIGDCKKCPKCDSEMKDKIIGDECIKCGFIKEAEK